MALTQKEIDLLTAHCKGDPDAYYTAKAEDLKLQDLRNIKRRDADKIFNALTDEQKLAAVKVMDVSLITADDDIESLFHALSVVLKESALEGAI